MTYRVGVDIGGTFTDLCAFNDKTNELHTLKVLSTPDRPGAEVIEGVRQLEARYGVAPSRIAYFTHGTTVGVNTVIQRKGVKLCLPVFCSTDVWSVIREYERTTTAVIHGYVQPRVERYLTSLQDALRNAGVPAEPMVTKSNGGVMSAELGKTHCAQMILSGTAAGVIGAAHVAGLAGFPATMSLDIGGTSA